MGGDRGFIADVASGGFSRFLFSFGIFFFSRLFFGLDEGFVNISG